MVSLTYAQKRILGSWYVISGLELLCARMIQTLILQIVALVTISGALKSI